MREEKMENRTEKIALLAKDVLRLSRNTLIVNLRFMDAAISSLKLTPDAQELSFSVDGRQIRYNPVFILRSYKEEKQLVTRQLLHVLFHCIFLHAFVREDVNRDYWNLACDIAVESVIHELELPCVTVQADAAMQQEIVNLRQRVKYMTAEVLYRFFAEGHLSDKRIAQLQELFVRDDHDIWYAYHEADAVKNQDNDSADEEGMRYEEEMHEVSDQQEPRQDASDKEEKQQDDSDKQKTRPNDPNGGRKDASDSSKKIEQKKQSDQDDSNRKQNKENPNGSFTKEELRKMWKDISQQMQLDLETFSREQGAVAGTLTQNLMAVNRESYDYSSFLKKFSTLGETLKVNDEEFDYIFYTYGLSMYGKMPLVEPLEYKEVKKVREFVIALDTSGSTSTNLVQKFVQKTYNILKQQENFFNKINLHIIQCDAEIQEDAKITTQEEFDDYLDHMQIRGLAGTDFRPVFSYVEYLMQKGEFTNLKGLIYFTDGFGEFPKKQPPYQVAIVYLDEGYENPKVPVWAIRLVLTPEEVNDF